MGTAIKTPRARIVLLTVSSCSSGISSKEMREGVFAKGCCNQHASRTVRDRDSARECCLRQGPVKRVSSLSSDWTMDDLTYERSVATSSPQFPWAVRICKEEAT